MRSDAIDPTSFGVPGGLTNRKQWRLAGATNEMFRDGRLLNVGGTAYALPGVLDNPQSIARLVGALAPEGSVVTGWAAALLHGVRDAGPTMLRSAGSPVQVCLDRHDHRVPPGFSTLRVTLDADDIETVDGLSVTTPARTAYDMARFSGSLAFAVSLLDAFRCELNPHPIQLGDLAGLRTRRPRGKGHPLLRSAEPLTSPRARSMTESRLRVRVLRTLDLMPHHLGVNVFMRGISQPWELDLVDWSSGLVLEYDSVHHASTEQRERDALKDLEVHELGLERMRINSITLGKPDYEFAALVRRARLKARSIGAEERAAELRSDGRLSEPPLRRYESAVG